MNKDHWTNVTTSTSNTIWNYKKPSRTRYSAGVLPYSFDQNGKCMFLLGKDNENDWSDFGGRCEFKDYNDPISTASREFYEETLGSVMSISEISLKINQPNCVKVISKTLNQSPYYMYLVYIDYLNYTETFNKTLNFVKYHYSQEKKMTAKIIEKNGIRWVNMDTLLHCMENEIGSQLTQILPLRPIFLKTLINCKEELMFLIKT
jgi:hypothetical protein